MHGAKVEVALGGDVGDVDGDSALLAERVDLGGGCGVVDGGEDHGDCGVVEVGGVEGAVDVGDEVLGDAVGDFGDEAGGGGDDGDEGVGIEEVEDSPGGDLWGGVSVGYGRGQWRPVGVGGAIRFRRRPQRPGDCGPARRGEGSPRAGPRGILRCLPLGYVSQRSLSNSAQKGEKAAGGWNWPFYLK